MRSSVGPSTSRRRPDRGRREGLERHRDYSYYCGSLCGAGTAALLRKVDGRWKVVGESTMWVS